MITVTEIVGQYGCGENQWLLASYASIAPHMKGKPIDTLKDERQAWLNRWALSAVRGGSELQ